MPVMVLDYMIKVGYNYLLTTPVSPAIMHIYELHRFVTLSEATYEEEGEIYALSEEEKEKYGEFLKKEFREKKPCVLCVIKDARLGSPLDKRKAKL